MAKKAATTENCKDCIHATDFHEIGADGNYFLCKCKFSNRSRFLVKDACPNFKKDGTKRE